jgi:succinate dehydrogenase / fumarate reductase flavoprotein subunit
MRRARTPPPRGERFKRGAFFGNPCYTQIHPTCIPVSGHYQSKLTLMSESLRNDGRVWVPKQKDGQALARVRFPTAIAITTSSACTRRSATSLPATSRRVGAKRMCDEGRGVGPSKMSVYLDFRDAIQRVGADTIAAKYGNLFQMYQKITDENPYQVPMRMYPAVHYVMGGSLESTTT